MKKIFLTLFLFLTLVSSSFADYREDFPDETICMFLIKKPVNPFYIDQAEKRGITCSGGNLVGKSSPSETISFKDEVEIEYEKIIVPKSNEPPKDICSETVVKRITTEEYLSESKSFIELKNFVIDVSLQNAFQQVNGSEIRNFESLNMSDDNGNEDINFNSSTYSKYEGLIDSYDVIDQEIFDLGSDIKVLSVVIDAKVCVKDKNELLKDLLLVGDFTYKNSSIPALKSEIESIFSKQSEAFELTYGTPRDSFHDILISGKIEKITEIQIVDEKATEIARKAAQKKRDESAGDAAFFSVLTAISNSDGNDSQAVFQDMANTLNSLSQQEIVIEMPEITTTAIKVFVSVTALNRSTNQSFTATAVSQEKITGSNYDITTSARGAVKKAAKELFTKLR